jgi:hypothetical protein
MIKVKRMPNESTYSVFFTLIIAFAILIIIYALTPYNHSSLYFIK